jgi:hypothetical protein
MTDEHQPRPFPLMAEDDLGGDPVCWLDRVCPECGRFAAEESEDRRCAECGAELA